MIIVSQDGWHLLNLDYYPRVGIEHGAFWEIAVYTPSGETFTVGRYRQQEGAKKALRTLYNALRLGESFFSVPQDYDTEYMRPEYMPDDDWDD